MKKILIALTICLAVFTVNVGAARTCEARLDEDFLGNIRISTLGRSGPMYFAHIEGKSNGKSAIAFCLGMGKPASQGDTYIIANDIAITQGMRKAYGYALRISNTSKGSNKNSTEVEFRYILAQTAIWISQQSGGRFDRDAVEKSAKEIFKQRYCEGKNCTDLDGGHNPAYDIKKANTFRTLFNELVNASPYTGPLYVYRSVEHPENQPFLSSVPIDINCKEDEQTFCPAPNEHIEITDCIKRGESEQACMNKLCISSNEEDLFCYTQSGEAKHRSDCGPTESEEACKERLCPESVIPACSGGVLKTVGTPAVCANDNQTHTGHYWQELDESECGDADEDGEPVRPIGDGSVAWLYCKEEAYQYYPGGIANPVPVGTHIVWPTSTATLNTIWGNLYSLSYEGIKTCKIKFSPNTKSQEDMSLTFQAHIANINGTVGNINYVGELENIRTTLAARGKVNDKGLATEDACAYSGDGAYGDQQVKSQRELEDAKAKLNECTTVTNTVDQNSEGRNNCKVACAHTEHTPETYADCINYCDGAYPTNNVTTTTSTCTNNEKRQREALVNQKQNELNAINAKINVCDNYIKAYNGATEFLNNIVFAGKTNWNPSDLYFFESDTSISYTDDKYGTEYQLKLSGETFECEGCNSSEYVRQHSDVLKNYTVSDMPSRFGLEAKYNQIVRLIGDRPITITATATYSLPDDLYHYVDRRTNTPLNYPTDDYIKIGYSNLPISSTANVKEPYNLNIIVNSLGQDGKFTELANQNPYVCNYSVTNAPTDECICPDGTKHAGKDLYCKIYGSNSSSTTITCADAQILYCDSDETFDEVCTDDKFCPNDRSIKITSCLNNGKDYDYCVSTLCGIDEDFHCPSGTFNDGMDIKPCVFSYMSLGYSKDEAAQICKDTVCPYKGGVNIIYRTISLRNPFPGKTAGSGVSNTTNKFSLDPHIGRYPGSNWNSVRLVETQILKNRGVEGNAVYQKTPLYTFILDTNTIKEIRKYNESRENNEGYADFTLDCDTNGVACISKQFVRNEMYGIQKNESVCGSSQHSDFYACSES